MSERESSSRSGRWIGALLLGLAGVLGVLFAADLWVEYRVRTEPGLTRLNEAVKLDSKWLVKRLLAKKADPNQGDVYGVPPLSLAQDKEMILMLLEAGAEVDLLNAICRDRRAVVRLPSLDSPTIITRQE